MKRRNFLDEQEKEWMEGWDCENNCCPECPDWEICPHGKTYTELIEEEKKQ